MENFLIVLQCGTVKKLRDSGVIRMRLACHEKHIIEATRK